MKLSCSSPMVPGQTITAKAEALKDWGFDAISIFHPFAQWSPAVRKEILGLEDRTGIVPCEFVLIGPLYGHLMDADPVLRSASRSMYREAAGMCAELDAVTELEFEYGAQDPLPLFDPYQSLSQHQLEAFVTMYRELLKPVQGTAASVLLEPLNRYESRYLNSVADCVNAVSAVRSAHAGLLLDFFHSSIEEGDISEAISSGAHQIKHVHLADNNRLLPGWGSTNWARCLDALSSAGYDGYLNLECSTCRDPAKTLPAVATYLRTFISS